jgi:hypothetical protein
MLPLAGQSAFDQQLQEGQTPMATLAQTSTRASGMTKDEKFVIFASSLGTVFEWYDFYLYATRKRRQRAASAAEHVPHYVSANQQWRAD